MKKKVCYVLYNERPHSGVIRNQVIELLKEISKNKKIKIHLISIWQPLIYLYYFNEIRNLRNELIKSQIILESYWFALPNKFFLNNVFFLNLLKRYLSFFFIFLKINRFQVIHCRSYVPSFIISKLNRPKSTKLIFDMRSLLPEENIVVGNWKYNSSIYLLWKKIELFTIKNSDVIITVSKNMKKRVKKLDIKSKIININLIGSLTKFRFNKKKRQIFREKYGIEDKFVVLYTGSLGNNIWNNINNYAIFVSKLLKINNKFFFIFSVPNIEPYFFSIFDKFKIKRSSYLFIKGIDKDIFNASDVGVNILSKTLDTDTRFGIKVAEYFSHGLPVILRNTGGAEEFVKKFNAGIVINNYKNLKQIMNKLITRSFDKTQIISKSEEHFSLRYVSKKYLKLYLADDK